MSRLTPRWSLAALVVLLSIPDGQAYAEKSAAEILPPSTLVYIEVTRPAELISLVLDHPVLKRIQEGDAWRQATSTPQYQQFLQVVGLVEQRAGAKWRPTVEGTTRGGIVLAFEPTSQGVVVLVRPDDAKTAAGVRDAIFSLARDDAKSHGRPDPIKSVEYRGMTAFHAGEAIVADFGPWLMIANKTSLAKAVGDAFLDGGGTLASDADFTAARSLATGGDDTAGPPGAWAFLRTGPLRQLPGPDKLFGPRQKSDNPASEVILGGVLSMLEKAPYVTASTWIKAEGIRLSLRSPADPAGVPEARRFFFAAPGDGAAKPLIPGDVIASLTTYRDISALWQSAPDLFTEEIATKFAQSDSGISTLFAGKSFSADILGALKPQMQVIVARQDYKAAGVPKPALRLPGFALVLQVKPEQFAAVRKTFRVGFQSAIALGNLNAGQQGRPMLEISTQKRGDTEIHYATYDVSDDAYARKPAAKGEAAAKPASDDVYLNFSPALVMSPKYLMLCSTKQMAEELADLSAKPEAGTPIRDNTLLRVAGPALAELIRDNREQLVAKNVLEKGHDRATAEKEIDVFQAIVGYFQEGTVRLVPAEKSIRLDVELVVAKP